MGIFSDILLTVDYDHTLTGPDAVIPERNLQAIRYFMENGGTFTVNTGRSIPMSACFRDIVPVNAPLLLYNGSAWYDPAQDTLSQWAPLDLDPAAVLPELQGRFPELSVEIQGVRAHYLIRENKVWERYCTHNGATWAYADPENIEQPFLKFSLYGTFVDENVSSMFDITPRETQLFEEAIAYITERYGDKVECFRACPRILDMHAKGCSKLQTARQLQNHLGKAVLVCVGDAANDLPMLEGADYAFCPADGSVADRFPNVCPCGDGAIADVIYKKIPEILGFVLDIPE